MLTIDLNIARRFILGKQGLWPGRRWRSLTGTEQAMREIEYLQLDPLQIIVRSHDIQLHSRVLDYTPALWEEVTYQQRKFFDWGGWLAVRPMDELPHWRVVMRREREGDSGDPRIRRMASEYAEAIAEMRSILKARATVSNRDFKMAKRTKTQSYRGRKDSSLALYYLWRIGEIMTHHRKNFERIYARTENVAPEHLIRESHEAEADHFLIKKEIRFYGIARLNRAAKKQLEALLTEGEIIQVKVEGWRPVHYMLGSDVEIIDDLSAGRMPKAWSPLETTTTEETVFLAPLDPVSARGRAKMVFDFDYVWEVYKPEHKRQFGYYTLPVLWGDRLVARFDSKLDRTTHTFIMLGFWPEDESLVENASFIEALARGLARFMFFLGADKLDVKALPKSRMRQRLESQSETDMEGTQL